MLGILPTGLTTTRSPDEVMPAQLISSAGQSSAARKHFIPRKAGRSRKIMKRACSPTAFAPSAACGSVKPSVGTIIHLDQQDDGEADQWPEVWNCQSSPLCSHEGGDAGRTGRAQTESVVIVSSAPEVIVSVPQLGNDLTDLASVLDLGRYLWGSRSDVG